MAWFETSLALHLLKAKDSQLSTTLMNQDIFKVSFYKIVKKIKAQISNEDQTFSTSKS